MNESKTRSLIKAYSYRVCGTMVTIVIAYIISGEFVISLGIGATELVVKPLLYWLHERVWNKINWGRI